MIGAHPYVVVPLALASVVAWIGGRRLHRREEKVTSAEGWRLVATTALCTLVFVQVASTEARWQSLTKESELCAPGSRG